MEGREQEQFGKDMDGEEVGGAVEGDDLALELLAEGGLHGDHHADRELLAADLHVAAAAGGGWVEVAGVRWVGAEECELCGVSESGRNFCGTTRVPVKKLLFFLTLRPACIRA